MGYSCSRILTIVFAWNWKLTIISLRISPANAFDRTFIQLTLDVAKHSDVVLMSDSIPVILPDNIRVGYQVSFGGSKDSFLRNSSGDDSDRVGDRTKIIISYSTVQESLDALTQLAESAALKESPWKFWILLHWPVPVDEARLNDTLEQQLSIPTRHLTVEHDFYVAFRNAEVMVSFHKGREGTAYKQPFEGFWFYEVYTVNEVLAYKKVESLGSVIVKCGTCESQTMRRLNLRGLLLRFEGVLDSEYNDDTLFREENGELVLADSLSFRILEILKQELNFTMVTFKSDNWGSQYENGTWYGVVRDVFEGKIDIGLTSTVMLPSRARKISFLPANDENILTAFFNPPPLNAIRDIFMQPFKKSLWAAVFATWFALASSMILFTMIRKKVGATTALASESGQMEPDLSGDSFIWVLATACQQGWDEHPQALSLRAIFISGSFTGVIAYAGYSAAIVSTLSLRIDPIQSSVALLYSNLKIGMRAGFVNDLLKQSDTQDIINALYHRLSKDPTERLVNVSRGVELLQRSSYAFICTKEQFYDIVKGSQNDSEICGITELMILKQGFKAGMFTSKTFPYRELFRFILILIRERGVLWRVRNDFTYTRRCLEATDNSGRALGANDVFTAFMILVGGYALSIVFMLLEKLLCLNPIGYIQ